jgi:TolB-like protein
VGPFLISRQAARALRVRWRVVALRERQELRAASYDAKLQQLVAMVESVGAFGWQRALAGEDEAVRERWRRLRRAYRE